MPIIEMRSVMREIEAARVIKEQLKDLADHDDGFIQCAIEGDFDIRKTIDALMDADAADCDLIEASKNTVRSLQNRVKRFESRVETRRALLASALEIAGYRKHESSSGTVSLKAVPPRAIVQDESAIPARFWRQPDPVLDKASLNTAVRERAAALATAVALPNECDRQKAFASANRDFPSIPGVTSSNGTMTVAIRRT